jgi:serine/threonine protein kinase
VTQTPIKGYAGTPGYIAPEIILERSYTKVVDFFSFGVMVYRMLAGRSPFEDHSASDNDRDKLVLSCVVKYPTDVFSQDAVSLISGLLDKDPSKRLGANSIEEIKSHAW